MKTMRMLSLTVLAALSALSLAACSTNPATGRPMVSFVSPQDEQRTGREMHPQILKEFGRYEDERAQAYVDRIGQSLVPHTELPNAQWTFTVLDSPIVNAFALPGGYVYVTRGLMALAQNEAELASVIGHEMGHVTARHSAQRQTAALGAGLVGVLVGAVTGSGDLANATMGTGQAMVSGYSRDQEFEADNLGIRYIARRGYDVNASGDFLARMGEASRLEAAMMGQPGKVDQYNIMSTHPRTPDRVERAAREAKASGASGTRLDRETYLAAVDGMVYGDSAAQGFVRGQRFVHPRLGIGFEAPPGFRLFNRSDSVVAQNPNGAAIVFDGTANPGGSMENYVARVTGNGARDIEALQINGLDAATGSIRGRIGNQSVDARIVALRYDSRTIYRFMFVSPVSATAGLQPAFVRTAQSFRRLSEGEAGSLRPYRVQVTTVRSGDTVQSLSARMPFPEFREERFRLLNGLTGGGTLRTGQQVKIVTE